MKIYEVREPLTNRIKEKKKGQVRYCEKNPFPQVKAAETGIKTIWGTGIVRFYCHGGLQ